MDNRLVLLLAAGVVSPPDCRSTTMLLLSTEWLLHHPLDKLYFGH
jgi:hypothetical protein